MKKGDTAYLRHILDAISRIEEYTKGIEYEDFMEDHLIQDGVIRQIEIDTRLFGCGYGCRLGNS